MEGLGTASRLHQLAINSPLGSENRLFTLAIGSQNAEKALK
jgi:hypothetical protein